MLPTKYQGTRQLSFQTRRFGLFFHYKSKAECKTHKSTQLTRDTIQERKHHAQEISPFLAGGHMPM